MLSSNKLKTLCSKSQVDVEQLAGHLSRGGFDRENALSALKNWQRGLYKPQPRREDVERLAGGLGVAVNDISEWSCCYRFAPMTPRKVRLVTELIAGRSVQDALDILKFTRKRAAEAVRKVLESAVANADEQEADVEKLYVSEARVDGAGRRIGTKAWIAKDRGRAHPLRKEASHIYVTVTEE